MGAAGSYLEFTVVKIFPYRYVGLTSDHSNSNVNDIDFAFNVGQGVMEVREGGRYTAEVAVQANDVVRITADDHGYVTFSINNNSFYSSRNEASFPLRANARRIWNE